MTDEHSVGTNRDRHEQHRDVSHPTSVPTAISLTMRTTHRVASRQGEPRLCVMMGVWCILAGLLCVASAINFDIAPGAEECFFEEVHEGTAIKGAYAVTQGSHMDIDVQIFNPRKNVIFNAKRDGEGKFSLKADQDGTYKFCFSNKVRFPCGCIVS